MFSISFSFVLVSTMSQLNPRKLYSYRGTVIGKFWSPTHKTPLSTHRQHRERQLGLFHEKTLNDFPKQGPRHEFESGRAKASKRRRPRLLPFYCSFKTTCFAKKWGTWPSRPTGCEEDKTLQRCKSFYQVPYVTTYKIVNYFIKFCELIAVL